MAKKGRSKASVVPRSGQEIIAYVVGEQNLSLAPAPRARGWMDSTPVHFANRCLPLLIANQSGWFVMSEHDLEVSWDGGKDKKALHVRALSGKGSCPAASHFGHGILTWSLPYLFRTPPEFSLQVRGPSNLPKHGAYPLEGLVETDWAVATFTMNWKLTRPDFIVRFSIGEPICMIVPQRRGELEEFRASIVSIDNNPDLRDSYKAWTKSRSQFNRSLEDPVTHSAASGLWEKHYFQGTTPDGRTTESHCIKRELSIFHAAEPRLGQHSSKDAAIKTAGKPVQSPNSSVGGGILNRISEMPKPRLSYLICSVPRCGSFLLAEALEATGIAGRPAEYFTALSEWRDRLKAENDPYEGFLRKVIARGSTGNGVFGAKAHWYQFESLATNVAALLNPGSRSASDFLQDIFGNLRYVLIRREDKIRQAVSYSKAIQSDVWWKIEGFKPNAKAQPVFDPDSIDKLLDEISKYESEWDRFFEKSAIRPHVVMYEDLIHNLNQSISGVLRYLDIQLPAEFNFPKPRLQKQANAETEEWVQRYLQLRAPLRSREGIS